MLGEMSFRAWVKVVKARSPDTESPVRISQSDQLMWRISGERMREADSIKEKPMEMTSPEIADQLTRTGVETPSHLAIRTPIRPPVQQAVVARVTPR